MGLVLPDALAWVLDMIGIEWPNIDEDELRNGADELREMADELNGHNGDAKAGIEKMLGANSSESLETFDKLWKKLSDGHLSQLSEGLNAFAVALDVPAGLVVGMKAGAIVQLGILAAEIIADQAAAPFTFGASEAAIPGEVEITSQIVKQIFKKIAEQVEEQVMNVVEGAVFNALSGAAGELATQLLGDVVGADSGVDADKVADAAKDGVTA